MTELIVYPTFDCNYNCLHCGTKLIREQNPNRKEIVNQRSMKRFLEGSQEKIGSLVISGGGEPTLYKALPKLTEIILETTSPEMVSIVTNGSNPKRLLRFVNVALNSDVNIIFIGVSVDGIGKIHDDIRRTPGAFSNAVSLLKLVNDIGREDKRVVPTISHTIMPWNHTELLKVYYLALAYQASFSTRIAVPVDAFDFTDEIYYNINRQLKVVTEMIERMPIPKIATRFNVSYLKGIVSHATTGKRSHPCKMPERAMIIDSFGDIYPCYDAPWRGSCYGGEGYKLGNIVETTLSEVLHSSKRKELIEKLRDCEVCWSDCSYHLVDEGYLNSLKSLFGGEER